MIILKIANSVNGTLKNIWEIMDPNYDWSSLTEAECVNRALKEHMIPTSYKVNCETYCKDADRTSDYELENIKNVNYKCKPEFVWQYLKPIYLSNLLSFIHFKDTYYDQQGIIQPENAPIFKVYFRDILRVKEIKAYLGATIDVELVEHEGEQYWSSVRLAFPEK